MPLKKSTLKAGYKPSNINLTPVKYGRAIAVVQKRAKETQRSLAWTTAEIIMEWSKR